MKTKINSKVKEDGKKIVKLSTNELKKINGGADLKKFAEDLVNLSVTP